jgi:hypothetical protein
VTTDKKVFEGELFNSRQIGGCVTKTTGFVNVTARAATANCPINNRARAIFSPRNRFTILFIFPSVAFAAVLFPSGCQAFLATAWSISVLAWNKSCPAESHSAALTFIGSVRRL